MLPQGKDSFSQEPFRLAQKLVSSVSSPDSISRDRYIGIENKKKIEIDIYRRISSNSRIFLKYLHNSLPFFLNIVFITSTRRIVSENVCDSVTRCIFSVYNKIKMYRQIWSGQFACCGTPTRSLEKQNEAYP